MIERACALTDGPMIGVRDLPDHVRGRGRPAPAVPGQGPASGPGPRGLAPGLRSEIPHGPAPAARGEHLAGREDGRRRPEDAPSPAGQARHQGLTGAPAEDGPSVTAATALPMKPISLTDGAQVTLRSIRPEDESALTALYERLSPETSYQRFFTVMRRLPPDWAHILANVDYDRRMAIVALGPAGELIGVARYVFDERAQEAEIAIVIEDRWQGRGLGTRLLGELIELRGRKRNSPPPGLRPRRQHANAESHPTWNADPGSEAGVGSGVSPPDAAGARRAGPRSGRHLRSPDSALTPTSCRDVPFAGAPGSQPVEAPHAGPGRLSRTGKLRVNVAPWPSTEWTSMVPRWFWTIP